MELQELKEPASCSISVEEARVTAASVDSIEGSSSITAPANQEASKDPPLEAHNVNGTLNGSETATMEALPFSIDQQATVSMEVAENRSRLERDEAIRGSLQSIPGYSTRQSEPGSFMTTEQLGEARGQICFYPERQRMSSMSPTIMTTTEYSYCPVVENSHAAKRSRTTAEPQQSIQHSIEDLEEEESSRELLIVDDTSDDIPLGLEMHFNGTNRESQAQSVHENKDLEHSR